MRSRIEDETDRRRKAENERDTLIRSLDDMTQQAKRLEDVVRDYEKENIDIYERLRKANEELFQNSDNYQLVLKEIANLKVELQKEKQCNQNYCKVIEDQQLLIGQQSIEITQLKLVNKTYDQSNKENVKNMNAAIERVALMSNERQKVKHELENIIQRRKSVKNLKCSSSLNHLSESKPYHSKFKDITNQSC